MIEFLAFRLDSLNQCLWRRTDSGEEECIRLPPRPYGLLRHLLEHAGRLVTEEEILEAVWPGLYVQPEAVKTHVHEIRKVLGDNAKAPRYIETVPRRGYQFIAPVREWPPTGQVAAASQPGREHLIGREPALSQLREQLHAASKGQRQVVFVSGEAGIGKTALVDTFLQRAAIEMPALRIVRGQCVEVFGDAEPYYPMLEALGQLCVGSSAALIVEILAAQAPTWLVQFPALLTDRHREVLRQELLGATRARMLREICTALETIAAAVPLLLVLEDLQWVDSSTINLISSLARGRPMAKLMLIATTRPVEHIPSGHPLQTIKRSLWAHQLCQWLDLGPLTHTQITEYLGAGSPQQQMPFGLADLIYRHSGGNPLFMVAALEHLTNLGFISRLSGGWLLRVPIEEIDVGVPETLRQLIEVQIERLSKQEQHMLEAASVQGVVFSSSICAAVLEGDTEEYDNLCYAMAQQGRFLRSAGTRLFPDGTISSRYEFTHALYREALYRRQAPSRRARLHRRIGERLELLYSQNSSEVGSELAHHFENGLDWVRTVRYLRLSADVVEARCGHAEAIGLLQRALKFTGPLTETERPAVEIGILERLADILFLSLDGNAPQAYELLASRASKCGAIDVEVRALIAMAVMWSLSDKPGRSMRYLDRAFELSAQVADPLARAASRATCLFWRLEIDAPSDEIAAAYANALTELQGTGDRRVRGEFLVWYSYFLFAKAEYRESRQYAIDGLRELTCRAATNPLATLPQVLAKYALFIDAVFLGEWGEALREQDAAIIVASKNANDTFANGHRIWRAWLSVLAMDFHSALAICQSAAEALGEAIIPTVRRIYLVVVATAELHLGQHERAEEHISLARQAMDQQPVMHDWFTRLPLESAAAELSVARGDLVQAQQRGAQFLQVALATSERTWQALAWETNARIALGLDDVERAAEHITKALSVIEGLEAPLAVWRVRATAAAIHRRQNNQQKAAHHRALSRATILRIANSMSPDEPMRKAFLSASLVQDILGGRTTVATTSDI